MKKPSLAAVAAGFLLLVLIPAVIRAARLNASGVGPCRALGAGLGPAFDQKITVKTENGILVVYNPKEPATPPGTPGSLTLKPDLTIGVESGDENYMFADLSYVVVDEAENIYTLDAKSFKIRVYDKNGKFLRSFGKKGQGPGEIGYPSRLEAAPGRQLVLSDPENNKFLFFSRDGTVEREVPMGTQRLNRFKVDSRGNFYAAVFIFDGAKATRSNEIRKLSADFNPWRPLPLSPAGFRPRLEASLCLLSPSR